MLSGTGFMNAGPEVRTDDVSPNQGSLERSLVPEGGGADAVRSKNTPKANNGIQLTLNIQ
jgi:hypothetical protein